MSLLLIPWFPYARFQWLSVASVRSGIVYLSCPNWKTNCHRYPGVVWVTEALCAMHTHTQWSIPNHLHCHPCIIKYNAHLRHRLILDAGCGESRVAAAESITFPMDSAKRFVTNHTNECDTVCARICDVGIVMDFDL